MFDGRTDVIRMRLLGGPFLLPTLYLETSIVSYLRQTPNKNVIAEARRLLTRRWWEFERAQYNLLTSQYVIDEVSDGDPALAAERLAYLSGIPLVAPDPQIIAIANIIVTRAILPPDAILDAYHIASTAFHRVQYLLTWNCKHIANAKILPRIHKVLNELRLPIPIICTPEEMVNDDPTT